MNLHSRLLLNLLALLPLAMSSLVLKAAEPGAKTYDLKYKFTAGETIRTRVVHRSAIRTTIKKETESATSLAESIKVWKVTAVNDQGHTTFVHQIEQVKMRGKIGDRAEVRYDSTKDKIAPIGYEGIADTVGVPLAIITLSPRGYVLKREHRLASSANAGGSEVTIPLPSKPVPIGQTWGDKFTIPVILTGGGSRKINARHHYTLKRVSGTIATIGMKTQILDPALPPKIDVQLIQRVSNGEVRFDMARGRVISQHLLVDGRVIDFHGAGSLMHCKIEFSEKLIEDGKKTASKATTEKKQ